MFKNYFLIAVIFSYSIGIAVLIALIRFKKILKSYRPFVYVVCAAFLTEILNTLSILIFNRSVFVTTFYALGEALLYMWLFHNWGALRSRKWHYPAMLFFLCAVWISDVLFWHHLTSMISLYQICYSFILIFLSISQLNKLIVQEYGNILRSAKFLICAGIILFFSFNATIEVFFLFQIKASKDFYADIYMIMQYVNLFVNLVYALAALWIPTRQRFTPSS